MFDGKSSRNDKKMEDAKSSYAMFFQENQKIKTEKLCQKREISHNRVCQNVAAMAMSNYAERPLT